MTENSENKKSAFGSQRLAAAVLEVLAHVSNNCTAIAGEDEFRLVPVNPVRIVLAYSGGRDSSAMLEVLSRIARGPHKNFIAGITVVHIHHGLSPNADAWVEHAKRECEARNLDLVVRRVNVGRFGGEGVEAAARQARYRELARVAGEVGADIVMTAHHLDDRIETFLIQWMRGAGVEGLSAMNPVRGIEYGNDGLVLARPWLDISREEIERFCLGNNISWVEDDSNHDSRFLRNLLRNEVLPILDKARSGWRQAAARSVSLVGQAAGVVRKLAGEDLAKCLEADGNSVSVERLLSLDEERMALCIRKWLSDNKLRPLSKAKLEDVLRQIRDTGSDNRLSIRISNMFLRRVGNTLILQRAPREERFVLMDKAFDWQGEEVVSLPSWGGALVITECAEGEEGISWEKLANGNPEIRIRRGGEKLKIARNRPSRHLKHHFQEAKISSYDRAGLPLLWLDGDLVWVAGLGFDVRYLAKPEERRVRIAWVPDRGLIEESEA